MLQVATQQNINVEITNNFVYKLHVKVERLN